jgi:predicted Rossmann fold flavoprotein
MVARMNSRSIGIVGGGAAGFFAALACAEAGCPDEIVILEKGPQVLTKVRISGGGRCNVTHAGFDAREFASRYPRGGRELIGPFKQFQASDTVAWFAAHGVRLKTESDGRMFPVTDSSQTIVDCLLNAAQAARVKWIANRGVERATRQPDGGFELALSNGERLSCDRLLLALGGCRTPALGQLAVSLGHTLEPPVPSLFTFHLETSWLRGLAGISVDPVKLSVPDTALGEQGALLVTHSGLSGPAVLRLSAWGARLLHERDYRFPLHVNWLPHWSAETLTTEFEARRNSQRAALGTIGSGIGCGPGHPLVGAFAIRPPSVSRTIASHGIRGERKESEPGGVRHLRRRAPGRGQFQNHGEPRLSRFVSGRRSARHRRNHRRVQLPGSLDDRLDRRPRHGWTGRNGWRLMNPRRSAMPRSGSPPTLPTARKAGRAFPSQRRDRR